MQTLYQVQLSQSEIQRIKDWLRSSDAHLFVETLRARSYAATLAAGELLKESVVLRNQQEIAAQEKAAQAGVLDALINEMERVASDDGLMVKLSTMPAPTPNPEEQNADADSV